MLNGLLKVHSGVMKTVGDYGLLLLRKLRFIHQLIDIQPVCLVRRNTSCGCVGMSKISHLLQVSHLISDGGRAVVKSLFLGERSGAYRFSRPDIVTDNGLQYLKFSFAQFHYLSPSVCRVSTQQVRVLTYNNNITLLAVNVNRVFKVFCVIIVKNYANF